MPAKIMMFMAAMISRNSAETLVPMIPLTLLKESKLPRTVAAKATAAAAMITTVECPMAKKKPTETGL